MLAQQLGSKYMYLYIQFSIFLNKDDLVKWICVIERNKDIFNYYKTQKWEGSRRNILYCFLKIFGVEITTKVIHYIKHREE